MDKSEPYELQQNLKAQISDFDQRIAEAKQDGDLAQVAVLREQQKKWVTIWYLNAPID